MDLKTHAQRWLAVVLGIVATVLFLGLAIYYETAAPGHPHLKHFVLFIVLSGASALLAWFSLPEGVAQGGRGRRR
jgi:heme A synthase